MIIASSSAHLSFKETLKTFPGAGMSGSGVREPSSEMSRLIAGIFSSPPPCQSPWGQKYLWAILTSCKAYLEGWRLRLPGPGWAFGVQRKCDLRTLYSLWICQALCYIPKSKKCQSFITSDKSHKLSFMGRDVKTLWNWTECHIVFV